MLSVHPGTAAVNQTACSFAIKGRAFATDIHCISESHKDNTKKKIGILTIARISYIILSLGFNIFAKSDFNILNYQPPRNRKSYQAEPHYLDQKVC